MEKTKLGLSAACLSALGFLLFFFGGYVAGLLFVGYVLLCEEDLQLKKSAVTALAVALVFSVANTLIGVLPDVVHTIESLLAIFTLEVYISFVDRVANLFYYVLGLAKTVVMLGMAVLALMNKPVKLAVLDKLFD